MASYFNDDGGYGVGVPMQGILALRMPRISSLRADAPVLFDMDADGTKESLGWPRAGSSIGFLALDRNGNSRIDDGSELFGVGMRLPSGGRASHGFDALRQHDGNEDGVIDAADPIWPHLMLWLDANHDGASEPGELRSVSATPITALSVSYRQVGRRDEHGNMLRFEALALSGRRVEPFYDIFLRQFP